MIQIPSLKELELLFEKLPLQYFILLCDSAGKIKSIKGKPVEKFFKKENKKPALIYDLIKENDHSALSTGIAKAEESSSVVSITSAIDDAFSYTFLKLEVDGINPIFTIALNSETSVGVDDLKKAVNELQLYQVITEIATDAVVGVDHSGKIFFWNKAAEQLFGYARSEVYQKLFYEVTHSFNETEFKQLLKQLEAKPEVLTKHNFITKKPESRRGKFLFKQNDIFHRMRGVVILCEDVTASEDERYELAFSEQRFKEISKNSSELIATLDTTDKRTFINQALLIASGYSAAEAGSLKFEKLFKVKNGTPEFDFSDFASLPKDPAEFIIATKSGGELEVVGKFLAHNDRSANIRAITCSARDITSEKRMKASLQMLETIFYSSSDGISVESGGKFIFANNSFAKIFGYNSASDILKQSPAQLFSPEDPQRYNELMSSSGEEKEKSLSYEFLATKNDGAKFFAEVSVSFLKIEKLEAVAIVVRDITERKRSQQALKESEEKYRSIAENIDDFFWTAEKVGDKIRPMFFTKAVEKITGFNQAEFIKDSKQFFRIIHPDDFEGYKDALKNFFQNYYKHTEEFEFRVINKQGNIVWLRNRITLVRNRKGEVLKLYGLAGDITLQKRLDEEHNEYTENLQKLNDTKDRFISIVSHDLRTPFSSVLGFTDILLEETDLEPEERNQYIKYIQESSKSMLLLVNSLLDWTRLQTGRISFEPAKEDLSDLASKCITTLSGFAMQKEINLINQIKSGFTVFVDKGLVTQVFNNLLSNALKFTPKNGTITIAAQQSDEPRFFQIGVRDTGVGIKEENLSKIFSVDSKFTTEGTGGEKGTGLGLNLVREIVEKHGGKIWVESKFGEGSTFYFTLPKASASILLVDDSNTDRILYSKILKNIAPDYEIITAQDGEEAYAKINETSPALVILDHIMPKLSGYQLVKKLFEEEKVDRVQIIILSSDIGKPEVVAYNELGIEDVFQKPVNLGAFKDAIFKQLKKLPV